MSERPITFTAPEIRAILAGTKSQTRRLVKPQPDAMIGGQPYWNIGGFRLGDGANNPLKPPYGQLWVREAWSYAGGGEYLYQQDCGAVTYRADHVPLEPIPGGRWRSPIHMPRWASRITLEVTAVRIERLQSISEEDARAEGVEHGNVVGMDIDINGEPWNGAYRKAFAKTWDFTNGKTAPWATSPWVWVIEFRRV